MKRKPSQNDLKPPSVLLGEGMEIAKAIYERGNLKLLGPITLEDGSHVEIWIIREPKSTKTPAEILEEIADMPEENTNSTCIPHVCGGEPGENRFPKSARKSSYTPFSIAWRGGMGG